MNKQEQAERAINLMGLLVEAAGEDEVVMQALINVGLTEIIVAMTELYDEITEDQLAEPPDEEDGT